MMFSRAALVSVASLLLTIPFTAAAPTNCLAPVRVITARGTDEIFGQSCLKNVFGSILGKGIGAVLQGTPYPAQLDYSNNAVYGGSVTQGVYSLQGIIKSAVEQCPNQKIVLLGYSQGANVVGDAICGSTVSGAQPISGQYADAVKAVVMFGDPTHVVGQSFVEGGSTQDGMIPRYSNTQCAPFTDRIRSYCHPNDPVCATGTDISQHLNYMPELDDDAASFVLSKL